MKKGFTLVELLAVIVILGIIVLVSVPMIADNINKSKVSAYRSSVQNAMDAAKEYVSKTMDDNDFPESGINIKSINYKNGEFESGIIKRNEEGEIVAVNIYNGKYCASGTKQNIIVEKANTIEDCESIDYTAPELKVKVVSVTNTSIIINAYGYEESSEIIGYSFKLGDNEKVEVKTNNRVASYEFNNLQAGTEYEIEVEVKNENANKKESQYTEETHTTRKSVKARTTEVGVPTFKVSSNSYAKSKEITIIYPSIENGVNSYTFREFTEEAEEIETPVEDEEISIEVTKNGKLTAVVDYGSGKVSNSINIIGVDDKGPEIVEINNPDTWDKTKVLTITVQDAGAGLATKPYSFDGGKTWIKGNDEENKNKISRVYTKNQEVTFLVRDKMGNVSDVEDYLGGEKIQINKVDNTAPECKLKVISGTLGENKWYKDGNIKDVTVGFESMTDTAIDMNGKVVETNGILTASIENNSKTKSLSTATGEKLQKGTSPQVSGITTVIKHDGIYEVTGKVYDEAGNSNTCTLEVKRDITHPSIKIEMVGTKINNDSLYSGDKEKLNGQVAYQAGSYIKTTCSDETSKVAYTSPNQAFTETSTESLKRYTKTGECRDEAGNITTKESDSYLILVNIRTSKCGYYATCRTSACGVESYNSCSTPPCGVAQTVYNTCTTSACGTYACNCYYNTVNQAYDCSYTQSYSYWDSCCSRTCINCSGYWAAGQKPIYQCKGCTRNGSRIVQQTCYTPVTYGPYCSTCNNTCSNPACGVAYYIYNSCSHQNCGIRSYKACSTSACGWGSCWQL